MWISIYMRSASKHIINLISATNYRICQQKTISLRHSKEKTNRLTMNVKNLRLYSFTCIIAFLVGSCISQTDYNEVLVRADSLMEEYPDSALHLLESIPAESVNAAADRAYHALLLTQARDKNFIPQTDDSLIQTAVRYFDRKENTAMQARAHYLWGSIYRDMNRCGDAIKKYHQAAAYAKKVDDKHLLGRIYNNTAALYYIQNLNHSADSIYRLSEQLGIQQNDSNLLAESLSQRGRIKMENGTDGYAEAEEMLLQALNMAHAIKNAGIEANISAHLSTLYSRMDLGEKALYYAKRNLELKKYPTHNPRGFLLLGNAYYKMGQYDSATVFLNRSLATKGYGIKSDAYMRLADIAIKQEYMSRAAEYEKLHSIYNDSAHSSLQDVDITKTEKQLQITENRILAHSFRTIHTYLIAILIAILVVVCLLWRYRKKTIDFLQHNDVQKEAIETAFKKLTNRRNTLTKETYELSEIYIKMKKIIQDHRNKDKSELQFEEEDWQQLIVETDMRWQNITLRLREQYDLTQEEIRLCCLYLTDFPTSHLQYILNCSRDSVYRKGYIILENKMGLSRKSTSLKKVLKSF